MPTKREIEYMMDFEGDPFMDGYRRGYQEGLKEGAKLTKGRSIIREKGLGFRAFRPKKPKRKLSAWNKFVKANAKKPRFRLRSGAPNLKKLGVAFRKTPAGRKKRR
jgi:hypothetical protein